MEKCCYLGICGSEFYLHGLWAQNHAKLKTKDCTDKIKFNIESIPEKVLKEMKESWLTCSLTSSDEKFWKYEVTAND